MAVTTPVEIADPTLSLRLSGAPVSPAVRTSVVGVDISEDVYRHARLSLLVDATADNIGAYTLGRPIMVGIGSRTAQFDVFDGVVTAVTAHFAGKGLGPTLQVEARSRSILLDPPRPVIFEKVSDADLAKELASAAGLTARTGEPGQTRPLVHIQASPWAYLVERGRALGWVTYVRGGDLVHRPPAASSGDRVGVDWTRSLSELHLTQDLFAAAPSSQATGLDPDSEVVKANADAGRLGLDVGRRAHHTAAHQNSGLTVPIRHDEVGRRRDAGDAAAVADGGELAGEFAFATGTAMLFGVPSVRCDSWMDVGGVDDRFAGPYYVSGVRHRWSRLARHGLTTEVQFGIPRPLVPRVSGSDALGAGLVAGKVVEADEQDAHGRVRVAFTWRESEPRAAWARVATIDAGDTHGVQFLPDPGTDVVVGFLAGDPGDPVVVGTLWNTSTALPAEVDQDNTHRILRTRSGHRIEFDDPKSGSGAVLVSSKDGRLVQLDDAEGSLVLSDEASGNSITISDAGITISAAAGDVTIESPSGRVTLSSMNFTVSAHQQGEVSAGIGLTATASDVTIQGSKVNIN